MRRLIPNILFYGQENLLWQRIVHCGAIFGRRAHIETVGGYTACYPVCVYEDSDLQWKLRERFTVRELHKDARFAVMHLDHELSYRSVAQEQFNKNIFELRKSKGVASAIEEDYCDLTLCGSGDAEGMNRSVI